jgi:DNA repair photolyase
MSAISYRQASSILTKPSGFINAFDFTLNPYSGCAFGCAYCYAAFFAPSDDLQSSWGEWVQVKDNALDLLRRKRAGALNGKVIYMSSVTDPYQPVERKLELTRGLLEILLARHPDVRLVVQTRGTLVTRDLDLLARFRYARVNMTVTTDDDAVRRAFEPRCPSISARLRAIQAAREAGVDACITLTPLLPVSDPARLAELLLATGVGRFVVQDFHAGKVRFAAGTGEAALKLAEAMRWDAARYAATVEVLRAALPDVREGKAGFVPQWD